MEGSIRFCDACGAANRIDGKFCARCGRALLSFDDGCALSVLAASHLLRQRYRVLKKLGEGGFGAIYQVEDLSFSSALRAVKEMRLYHIDPQEMGEAIAAFKQEAMLLAGLMHPNLPRIYDHFEERGRWYLVMDYVEGETLERLLEQSPEKKFAVQQILPWAMQLCAVLGYLHGHQPPIIFRDLKPANIMLTAEEHLYLVDFGIARLFKTGQTNDTIAMGTPGYAAPEQYGKTQTTEQADIYALGATLHHLISGRDPGVLPFQFPPLDLQQERLETLIMQMVEPRQEKRPANVQMIKQELQNVVQQLWQPSTLAASQVKRTTGASQASGTSGPLKSGASRAQANSGELFIFREHQNAVNALIWLPDSIHVVSAGPSSIAGAGLHCWDSRTGQVFFSASDYTCGLTGSPKYRIAFGTEQGLQVRVVPTGEVLYAASALGNFSLSGLQALAWSPDGAYLACGTDNGAVVLWDVVSHSIFARSRLHGSEIHSCAWSPDSKQLVLGCDDARMCVLRIAHKTSMLQRKSQPLLEHVFTYAGNDVSCVTVVAWSPDGKHISGNMGGKIYVARLSDGTGRWFGDGEATVKAVAWSADGQYVVSGGSDGAVRVWEAATGNVVVTYRGHTEGINAVAWSADGEFIVSGGRDCSVRVWGRPDGIF